MNVLDVFWLFLILSSLSPAVQQWILTLRRGRALRALERRRHSRVITLIHRREGFAFLGIPFGGFIDIDDSQALIRGVELTGPPCPHRPRPAHPRWPGPRRRADRLRPRPARGPSHRLRPALRDERRNADRAGGRPHRARTLRRPRPGRSSARGHARRVDTVGRGPQGPRPDRTTSRWSWLTLPVRPRSRCAPSSPACCAATCPRTGRHARRRALRRSLDPRLPDRRRHRAGARPGDLHRPPGRGPADDAALPAASWPAAVGRVRPGSLRDGAHPRPAGRPAPPRTAAGSGQSVELPLIATDSAEDPPVRGGARSGAGSG